MNPLIEKYIDNSLSPAEQAEIDTLFGSDMAFRADAEKYMMARSLASAIIEDEIMGNLEKIKQEGDVVRLDKTWWDKYKWLIISIGLLSLTLVYILLRTEDGEVNEEPSGTILFAQVYQDPVWPIERGTNDSLQLILSDYLTESQDSAINKLEKMAIRYPDSSYLQYWLMEMYIKNSQPDLAKPIFDKLTSRSFANDRMPYLETIMLLQQGKTKEVLDQIDAIYITSHPDYQKIYDEIKNKLKKG